MLEKCNICGMIRSTKDLVLREDGNTYICFKCWNKYIKDKMEKSKKQIEYNISVQTNRKHYLKKNIIEMFVDKTECITSLFIAKQGVEQKLSLFVKGGNINLKSLEAWERKPINKGQQPHK